MTLKLGAEQSETWSAFEADVAPGFDVGAHLHHQAEEVFYVLEGELDLLAFQPAAKASGDWRTWESATGAPVFTPKEAFYILLSYLSPAEVGMGKIQPLVRLQQTADPGWTIFDGAVAYVIKDYGARLVTTYEHIDTKGLQPTANSIQFGFQLQK